MTGQGPISGLGLPRRLRLLRTADFRRVYQRGRRVNGPLLTVVGRRARGSLLRVGLSVSKDHGPAVRRNKIKRLLREAFRHERPDLPTGFDLVLIPRPRPQQLILAELRVELARLVRRLTDDLHHRPARRRAP